LSFVLGFTRYVKHLDGRFIEISSAPGEVIKPREVKCVPGEGMPRVKRSGEKGDLYIRFDIVFPDNSWTSVEDLKSLRTLLPKDKDVDRPPEGCVIDPVNLTNQRNPSSKTNNAHDDDEWEDDDDDDHAPNCATQ
jgi:DnaJ family protein A protein 2